MARGRRVALAIGLAAAVVASLLIRPWDGPHVTQSLLARRLALSSRFPTVSPLALERGCAAWQESIADCATPEPTGSFGDQSGRF